MSLKEDKERELEALRWELKELNEKRDELCTEIRLHAAWLEGWLQHEALLVTPPLLPAETLPAETPRQKNVKKAVMECFTECTPASWRTIATVAEYTALPQESVYHCVMREVRRGVLERGDQELIPMFRLNKIVAGLRDAVNYEKGDMSAALANFINVPDGEASGLV